MVGRRAKRIGLGEGWGLGEKEKIQVRFEDVHWEGIKIYDEWYLDVIY